MKDQLPILYSFRRCPYAMRARLAIMQAGVAVVLREVQLRNKPVQLLAVSPKGTVPVLVLPTGQVIDESLDIMCWALSLNDQQDWLSVWQHSEIRTLIHWNDGEFKQYLDRYKYADRYPENPQLYYRQLGELFLTELEQRLQQTPHLAGARFSIADAAIAPFIRQFAAVDPEWFGSSQYTALRKWLQGVLDSTWFQGVMQQYQPWTPDMDDVIFASTVSSRDK